MRFRGSALKRGCCALRGETLGNKRLILRQDVASNVFSGGIIHCFILRDQLFKGVKSSAVGAFAARILLTSSAKTSYGIPQMMTSGRISFASSFFLGCHQGLVNFAAYQIASTPCHKAVMVMS